ncbi:MAG: hypothetical protein ACREFB_01230 [Stellaceae bacterium]
MPQRDVRHIIRQWDREIQEQQRRDAERESAQRGPWRFVSGLVLWFLWLGVLVTIVALIRPLHW